MSMNLMKGKMLPIGIDLGTSSVKMAQLKAMPSARFSLMASACQEVPAEARRVPEARARFLVDTFRRMMVDHPFKGRQCILCIPAEMTFVQHIKLAKMPADQLEMSLQWELQGKLPYDPSRAVIRHVVAGDIYAENEVKQEVIVLAANRDVVESHIGLAHRAKLDCVGINVEPCAIVECFARLFRRSEDVTRATLFVDIGAASTQVVICHGPRLAFAKNLFVGGARLDQAVADGLRVPLDEAQRLRYRMTLGREQEKADEVQALLAGPAAALAEELTSCLRYYESVFANRPVERAVFLGGQAYDKRLCQALAKRLAVPAQIGDPLAGIQREPGSDHEDGAAAEGSQPEWAVAVGLSLGGAGGKSPLARQEEAVLS